jgi:hypothetical protein
MSKIPSASVLASGQVQEKKNMVRSPIVELTEEEKQRKYDFKLNLLKKCADFLYEYIEDQAAKKIKFRSDNKMNSAYVFRYSPPAGRDIKTFYYSQLVIDGETNQCSLDYCRPNRHPNRLWYFPIFYIMNGVSRNPERTFEKLGIESVQNRLRSLLKSLEHHVSYRYIRNKTEPHKDCNVVLVQWGITPVPKVAPEAVPEKAPVV